MNRSEENIVGVERRVGQILSGKNCLKIYYWRTVWRTSHLNGKMSGWLGYKSTLSPLQPSTSSTGEGVRSEGSSRHSLPRGVIPPAACRRRAT